MTNGLSTSPPPSAREKILDAAARVMHEKGLAKATTREIAREAGYSEALLYKHFADKQDIYLGVLRERTGGLPSAASLVGTSSVRENLVISTTALMAFYVQTFPMSASLFSVPELLVAWREGMAARRVGPDGPLIALEAYLKGEQALGRIPDDADTAAIATALCGAAFQQAFLACFHGRDAVPDARQVAERLVSLLL